ncbi:MAG: PEP-CTERM sorting domain-containing protein [Phycisphaeraceae bacterium]|nr:PEP-CTERM sorting domain-containing protein [Phycisphaeraceae bacterium]
MIRLPAAVCAVLAASCASGSPAGDVVVFDFEEFPGNPDRSAGDKTALLLVRDGFAAVIKRTSGEKFTVWNSTGETLPASWGSKHLSPTFNYFKDDYFVISFTMPVYAISIEFGDFGQDQDTAEIHAYTGLDGTGDRLGSAFGFFGYSDISVDPPTRVEFAAAQGETFSSVLFRAGANPFFQSAFMDNIVIHTDHAPAPGTLALLALGALGARHRRRR